MYFSCDITYFVESNVKKTGDVRGLMVASFFARHLFGLQFEVRLLDKEEWR
jgi:hypothetical protein